MQMGRPPKAVDYDLTAELGIDELCVVNYENGQYIALNADHEVPRCIRCGGKTKNYKTRDRLFSDCIYDKDGKLKLVFLTYKQYLYQCQTIDCHKMFPRKIDFARVNAKITKRLEEMIVHYSMFLSYGEIKKKFGDNISRSTVMETITNWTKRHDEKRGKLYTPETLCIFTFLAKKLDYVIVADGSENKRCILDIIPRYSTESVIKVMSRFEESRIKEIIVDTNSTVADIIRERFPDIKIQVHPKALIESAKIDLKAIIQEEGPHLYNVDKESLLKSPKELEFLEGSSDDVETYNKERAEELGHIKRITTRKPRIGVAYDYMINLYKILDTASDEEEIKGWKETVSIARRSFIDANEQEKKFSYLHEDDFGLTFAYIEDFMKEMINFYRRRTEVTKEIYDDLVKLNRLIEEFTTYSEDALRAKILYKTEPLYKEIDGKTLWHGVPLEKVLITIAKLLNEWRRKK